MLGLAYKPNVDDKHNSPSYLLIEVLEQSDANVAHYDPLCAGNQADARALAIRQQKICRVEPRSDTNGKIWKA